MKDRTRLIRTPNARIAPFCEVCGRVDGPLPFGRGEVMLTYSTKGARCQDHPLQGGTTYEELQCLELADLNDRQGMFPIERPKWDDDDQAVIDAFLGVAFDPFESLLKALEG